MQRARFRNLWVILESFTNVEDPRQWLEPSDITSEALVFKKPLTPQNLLRWPPRPAEFQELSIDPALTDCTRISSAEGAHQNHVGVVCRWNDSAASIPAVWLLPVRHLQRRPPDCNGFSLLTSPLFPAQGAQPNIDASSHYCTHLSCRPQNQASLVKAWYAGSENTIPS